MPTFSFECSICNKKYIKLLKPEDSEKDFFCLKDNAKLFRTFDLAPSTIVKETLDNGLWPRRVEQYANVHDLVQEHEDKK